MIVGLAVLSGPLTGSEVSWKLNQHPSPRPGAFISGKQAGWAPLYLTVPQKEVRYRETVRTPRGKLCLLSLL